MANRMDELLRLLKRLDERTRTTDDYQAMTENTVQDLFFPVSEELSLDDTVETATYDPSAFVWGNGVDVVAGWDYNGGGRWAQNVTFFVSPTQTVDEPH